MAHFICQEFLYPPSHNWWSIYISVPGVFTEKRSSINSFVTAMWADSHNSKTNPSIKTKQRFVNSQWAGKHNDTQDLLIRELMYWLSRQSITCVILLLDFCILPIVVILRFITKVLLCVHRRFSKIGSHLIMTNSHSIAMNSIARVMNLIANGTNSFTKTINSIAKKL